VPNIKVEYQCACTRCGTVNVEREIDMDQEFFDRMTKEEPKAYWKEDKPKGVVNRHFEETSEGNCPRSC